MGLFISAKVQQKIATRNITRDEIEQCFLNHHERYLIDEREDHRSDPPALWFVGATDSGRRLKVVFIDSDSEISLRTAYAPSRQEEKVYFDTIARKPRTIPTD